jgi:hypothetical protein
MRLSIKNIFKDVSIQKRKKIISFLSGFQLFLDLTGLVIIGLYFAKFVPREAFTNGPATGGDTASHYWPLVTLVKEGLPHFSLRIWNPGNLGGEPHLVHYFPFAFLLMAFFSIFTSLGTAFNIGTLVPLFLLPYSVYFCLRAMKFRFPTPILGACFSLFFIYNESYSMFGGNTLSTLAGQFSHGYALNLVLLGVGILTWELRRSRFPFLSGIVFSFLIESHAYVALIVPFFYLAAILFEPPLNRRKVFKICLYSGIVALALSLWYLLPMIDNSPWTTAHPETWDSKEIWQEIAPFIFLPPLILGLLSVLLMTIAKRSRQKLKPLLPKLYFWLLPTIVYVGLYYLFPKLGVVDVRAVPQIQLFLMIISAILVGTLLNRIDGRFLSTVLLIPLLLISIWWADKHVHNFSSWMKWNYSGWQAKSQYGNVKNLTDFLQGDFSKPRVVYEHNDITNSSGTLRLFEMLPYFSTRATTESLYLQATILAPMVYDLQAEVSKTPSCPYWRNYKCPHYNFSDAVPHMKLLGVQDMILITPEIRGEAEKTGAVIPTKAFGPWHLYTFKDQTKMVEVPKESFNIISEKNWKESFFNWYRSYNGFQKYELVDKNLSATEKEHFTNPKTFTNEEGALRDCQTDIAVDFTGITLGTGCPGRPHILKFAYHPTFRADTGDKIYLVSPGFMMITPSKTRVHLEFGQSLLWRWSGIFSALSYLLIIFLMLTNRPAKKV